MPKHVVCIGGGHCNCQVLKMLKSFMVQQPDLIKLTIVSERDISYYSGMLPGTVSKLYNDEDLVVYLRPLAAWCQAEFIQQRVEKIMGAEQKLYLGNGEVLEYDVLVINVGSKTKDTGAIKGVWEHALTTRPINDMIDKVQKKEKEFQDKNLIPDVVICGAGAAGTELSFAFKKRWSDLFNTEVRVQLITAHDEAVQSECDQTKAIIKEQLKKRNIELVTNGRVKEISSDKVILEDGRELTCNVTVWATGAEPQQVSADSDLELLNGFFRVNNFMQSTSYPNIFAGGDCVTMESYVDKPYPTKAGVYAVRQGPIIAENVKKYILGEPLVEYVPQTGFLSLMMTGDGDCIGSKHGVGFYGTWVWGLKDFIDMSFMNLFNPKYLFENYETEGTAKPLPNFALFDDASEEDKE